MNALSQNVTQIRNSLTSKADSSTVTAISNNVTKLNSKSVSLTLSAGSWYGTSIPYSYTISNSNITTTNILDLIINANTQALVDAVSSYQITGYKQESGKVTIYAWGEKPSITLPATLVVRGGY